MGAALFAATATCAPISAARAQSCNAQDLWNALSNTWQDTATCAAACADGVGCYAAFLITGGLATAAAGGDQNAVNSFCTTVQTAADDAATIIGDLRAIGVSDSVVQSLSSAFNSISSPLAAAQCACDEVRDAGSLISDIGQCIEDGVCIATQALGGACGCTQPPTTVAGNCAPVLAGCGQFFFYDLSKCSDPNNHDLPCLCAGSSAKGSPIISTGDGTSPPYVIVNTPGGTEIIQSSSGSAPFGTCGTSWACFCPKPMTLQHTCDGALDPACNNNIDIWYCACPKGTHGDPAGDMSCLCDSNNQPANFDPQSFLPVCGCPTGQVSWDGKCVAACAKNDVRTPDGTCCNPNQVTFCGQCCPPGWIPDPVRGICYQPQQTQ